MIRHFLLFFMSIVTLSGCGCKTSLMPEVNSAEPYDQYLNCQQLVYAINEAEFGLKNVAERCARPHIFAKFVGCTAEVKRDAAKNEYILWDRIDYLKTLYKLKKCSLGIADVPIATQASNVGVNNIAGIAPSFISKNNEQTKSMESLRCKNCKVIDSKLPPN